MLSIFSFYILAGILKAYRNEQRPKPADIAQIEKHNPILRVLWVMFYVVFWLPIDIGFMR